MTTAQTTQRIQAVRRFNRFYTGRIGVLRERALQSEFSLTELRLLYELANRKACTATELCQDLGLDAGYVSRILRDFGKHGLLQKSASKSDRRQVLLALSKRGKDAFAPLDTRQAEEVAVLLRELSPAQQLQLTGAMQTIERLLSGQSKASPAPYVIRPLQSGDRGWVVYRHGVLYSQEYGYDEHFEALVAGIVAEFVEKFDAKHERAWIAEKDGEVVGSVFLVKKSKTISKLRLLLVEPSARGMGIGKRLVAECVRFAQQAGYKKMVLWTQSELGAARHLYEQAGFRLAGKKPHKSWGRDDLVSEVWELHLKSQGVPA